MIMDFAPGVRLDLDEPSLFEHREYLEGALKEPRTYSK